MHQIIYCLNIYTVSYYKMEQTLSCAIHNNILITASRFICNEKNMFVGTSKEKYYYHNTLLCLVKSLQHKNITMDLRNDAYVCGCVASVDGFMNVSFSKAVYCDTRGNEYFFENMFVHARNIRYVHVPETMHVLTAIRNELIKAKRERNPTNKPVAKTRKAKKALQLHMQTVASLDSTDLIS